MNNENNTLQNTTAMKVVSLKIPLLISIRTEALKEKTGISESAILRQCIIAGLSTVEKSIDLIHADSLQESEEALPA